MDALRVQMVFRNQHQRLQDYGIGPGSHIRLTPMLSPVAGMSSIMGALADQHGNAAGHAYDLGNDNAFKGLEVLVIHLYDEQGFDFKLPQVTRPLFSVQCCQPLRHTDRVSSDSINPVSMMLHNDCQRRCRHHTVKRAL